MSTLPFAARAETFGLETDTPWGLELARVLFNVPRTFLPLVDALEGRSPGFRASLERLTASGFVAYQPGVVVDTRTGLPATRPSRAVCRYRTTPRGRRLLEAARQDLRVLADRFPRTTERNLEHVHRLVQVCHLEDANRRFGLSAEQAVDLAQFPSDRSGRWWVQHLVELRYLQQLPDKLADVREVIPPHWRPTRAFARQLLDVVEAFPAVPSTLPAELRLRRSRFLDDIDPARIGVGGATDFDHDIEAQKVLAALLRSPKVRADGIFQVEPRFALPLDRTLRPPAYDPNVDPITIYQPDAELRETGEGPVRRSVVEYERFQSRRDAWGHIERFLGWLHTFAYPFEPATLRFVVDSPARARSYVALIEAFADYLLDEPDRAPANPVLLAVTTTGRLLSADDPLDDRHWHRLPLPAVAPTGAVPRPRQHPADDSPYDDYFGRFDT